MSEKNAIVLLPGMDGTGELLRPLAKRLSAHRPVHLIDYPVDRFLNYDQLVLYVKARLPDDRFVILGESFSGPVAIEIAATESKAAGLILAASFARHPLPTLLTAFTGLLDLRWIPTSIIVAALMGSAATPEIKHKLRQVLAALPGDILTGAGAGGASRRQAETVGRDHVPHALPARAFGPSGEKEVRGRNPCGTAGLSGAVAGFLAHASGD
jgi:pimeloyl-ACP methyl ester carboxylesterase